MSFEIEGKLIEKFDTQKVSDSFRKREFVLETDHAPLQWLHHMKNSN